MVISAGGLSALPSDADPQQLAMLAINPPTAALLLSEYVDLQPGEWVVQNAANSGVGRWLIAFAKTRGLKTVNIVRRPELTAELEAIGGDLVVVNSPDVPDRIKAAVGQAELRLALDGVSGPATGVLAATLSPHGTLVSFAAMSEGPMSINPLDVIFKPLTMRGFWLGHPEIATKIGPAIVQAAAMITSGRVHIPVAATYPISSIKTGCRACATGRKDPSRRCRIIYLTSESSIRYGHRDQDQLRGKKARGQLLAQDALSSSSAVRILRHGRCRAPSTRAHAIWRARSLNPERARPLGGCAKRSRCCLPISNAFEPCEHAARHLFAPYARIAAFAGTIAGSDCGDRQRDPQQTSQRTCSWGRRSVPRPSVSKTPYKHRLHKKEARAERGLLSNLFRQSRKIVSAVK